MKNPMIFCVLYGIIVVVSASNPGGVDFCSWYNSTYSSNCSRSEFRCANLQKCIRRELFSNGVDDCGDGSDELYYGHCTSGYISCGSNGFSAAHCILRSSLCDGHYNCRNNYDENSCGGSITKSGLNRTSADRVIQWINGQRKEANSAVKWGSSVDRLALILYLAVEKFDASLPNRDEIEYELNIQMLSRLSNKKLEDIPSTELASYLNAFSVMCINPRNFHGFDIIEELRDRVDEKNYTNPYVLLALCNAGETITESDKKKLVDTFRMKRRTSWTGMQAVAVMALACANRQLENQVDADILHGMTLELKQQQFRNGTVVNLPTTALVMQALIATASERDPDNFDEMKAYRELLRNQKQDGSFGDIMSTFLVTPVLNCKSLADIKSDHCQYGSEDEVSALENLSRRPGPKIRVQYSLWIGNDKDLERNLVLRVPQNMSLYGIMETAAKIDSRFAFDYSVKNRKPYVNAISGMRDNPLTGKFWFLYAVQDEKPNLSNESPADIKPKDNDHYIMWYRRGTWVD